MSIPLRTKKRFLLLFPALLAGLYTHAQFEPTDLAGLELWVKADTGITLNGNFVAQWDDQSGNNRHCTSDFDVIRPTLLDDAINGLPSVSFDGVEDFLQFPEITNLRTVFWVLRENPGSTGTVSRPLLGWSGGLTYLRGPNKEFWYPAFSDPAVFNGQTRLNFEDIDGPTTVVPTEFCITSLVTTGPLSASHLTMELNIFGRTWWGEMAEVLIYSNPLSAEEILQVENYLATKYSPPFTAMEDIEVEYGFCDTLICAPPGFTNYVWNNSTSNPCIAASQEGTYALEMNDAFGRILRDTIEVRFPGNLAIPDTQICAGDHFIWNTELVEGDYSFLLNQNSSLPDIDLTTAGDYEFTVTDTNGCSVTDLFQITVDPFAEEASLGPDIELCAGNTIGFQQTYETLEYLWNTDETTETIIINSSGEYWLQATNALNCVARDTIDVTIVGVAPQINFTAIGLCEDASTQFTAINNSSSEIESWTWDFGDGESGTGETITHTFAVAGDFEITLTAQTVEGCTNTVTQIIHINQKPQPQYTTNQTCNNLPIEFTDNSVSAEGNITAWNWLIEGIFYSDSTITANISQPGLQNILLEVTTDLGCSAEVNQSVNIKAAPLAGFSSEPTCEGELTQFINESNDSQSGPLVTTIWNFGDNTGSTLSEPSHFYSSEGTYTTQLAIVAANGCVDTLSQEVVVHSLPLADFVISNACLNQEYVLQDASVSNGDEITSWYWEVGGQNFTQENPVVIFTEDGLNTVQLAVTTLYGCTASIQQQIPVWNIPVADYSFSPEIGLAPFEVQFINESQNATEFHWIFGDTFDSEEINPVHIYSLNGTFYTRLIAINHAGCTDTLGQIITVADPTLDVMIELVTCTETPYGQQVSAKLINTGNITIEKLIMSYQVGNDAPILEVWEGNLPRSTSMIYTFSAYLQTVGQQFPYVCITAETSPLEQVETNLTDNQYCKPLESVGLELFPPYPNPGDDRMFIRFITPLAGDLELYVFDVKGSRVMEILDENVPQGFHQYFLDISALEEGPYKLQLILNDKKSVVSFLKVRAK
ncbi:MAG: PKD domain-containing protein [Flavobacteriales bacterium]